MPNTSRSASTMNGASGAHGQPFAHAVLVSKVIDKNAQQPHHIDALALQRQPRLCAGELQQLFARLPSAFTWPTMRSA